MTQKLRNIIEDLGRDCLTSALQMRYDICTCAMCRNDMLAHVLSHVPAKYVTTESGALHAIIQQSRVEYQAQIARAVIEAIDTISRQPRHELKEDKKQMFLLLLDNIREARGLDFHHYHQELLKRRVAIRMRVMGVASYSDYLRLLMNTPEEYDKLFEVLCINVSEFFRDPEIWDTVKKVLDGLLKDGRAAGDRPVKIWSAGCANGEEPHTIALLLRDVLKADASNRRIEIIATDVDKKSLGLALKGEYGKDAVRHVDKKLLAEEFQGEGGIWRIKPEVRKMITYRYLDLTSADYVADCDIVFCRNVFIYFDRNLQEQLLMKFYNSLRTGGYLVMGKSETLIREASSIFEEIDLSARLYRKRAQENGTEK
jgi:chemotaxis protein methyltransferase CheR